MQTVIETSAFVADAKGTRLTDDERETIILKIATDPHCGVEIPGTGGARKIRFAGRGKGKSGGYRVITFFGGVDIPVFALSIFAKGDQSDLTQADRNEMRKELAGLVKDYKTEFQNMSKAGERILASIREARAIVRGEITEGFVVHHFPDVDVKAIRARQKLSQVAFAARYGFSPSAVREWEQRRRQPDRAARVLLMVIDRNPEVVNGVIRELQTP